jgi:hypothetical protein
MSWRNWGKNRDQKNRRDKWACTGVIHTRKDKRLEEMVAGMPEQTRWNDEPQINLPGVGIVPASTAMTPTGSGGTVGYNTACYTTPYVKHREHKGDPIMIGGHKVLAGAMRDLTAGDLAKADILVPLTQDIPYMDFGVVYQIIAAPLVDYGGVPENWGTFLQEVMIPLINGGNTILAYCVGSHGRTGTFLASLIALMESREETPDPIAAVRDRHCHKCVESLKQAEAIFALRGEVLPAKYEKEFTFTTTSYGGEWWKNNNQMHQNYYGRHGGGTFNDGGDFGNWGV